MNEEILKEKKRFDSIDCLRSISCLAIIAMHIRANSSYELGGWLYDTFVPSWTWFVYLFIMISGFSMCAGYLDRFQKGNIDLEAFYKKRYAKILPFFFYAGFTCCTHGAFNRSYI